eukprot:957574-Pelagomonas_calceolata.AAC.8
MREEKGMWAGKGVETISDGISHFSWAVKENTEVQRKICGYVHYSVGAQLLRHCLKAGGPVWVAPRRAFGGHCLRTLLHLFRRNKAPCRFHCVHKYPKCAQHDYWRKTGDLEQTAADGSTGSNGITGANRAMY